MKGAVQTLETTMNKHIESFHERERACQRMTTPVITLRDFPERVEDDSQPAPIVDAVPNSLVEVDAGASLETEAERQAVSEADPSVTARGGDQEIEEDVQPQQDIAIIRNDGTLVMVDHHPCSSDATVDDSLYSSLTYRSRETAEDASDETHSQSGTEDHIFSDSEESTASTDINTRFSRWRTPGYVTMALSIRRQGTIILDQAVAIANCRLPGSEGFYFCARTLIVDEQWSATLVLKEPCHIDRRCQHCLIHAMADVNLNQYLPLSLKVFLEPGPSYTPDDNANPDRKDLKCSVFCSAPRPELYTLVLHGGIHGGHYAVPRTYKFATRPQAPSLMQIIPTVMRETLLLQIPLWMASSARNYGRQW
jgi:hypothetical protein